MKGQNAVFEEVLLFGISVAIFIMAFAIFSMYQNHFTSTSINDHTRAVRDIVLGHVVELTRIDDLNASFTMRIPKEIGGEHYTIYLDNNEIGVVTDLTNITVVSNIASLSTVGGGKYTFSGETTSSRGELIIYKRGYNIIID
jgi:hypothetical protein